MRRPSIGHPASRTPRWRESCAPPARVLAGEQDPALADGDRRVLADEAQTQLPVDSRASLEGACEPGGHRVAYHPAAAAQRTWQYRRSVVGVVPDEAVGIVGGPSLVHLAQHRVDRDLVLGTIM